MLDEYIAKTRPEFQILLAEQRQRIEDMRCRNHPGKQAIAPGGLKLHLVSAVSLALFLNQTLDEQEVVECLLVHDLPNWEEFPLSDAQRLAIRATKGRASFKEWRHTPHFRFVALILICDMWSAYINEKDIIIE